MWNCILMKCARTLKHLLTGCMNTPAHDHMDSVSTCTVCHRKCIILKLIFCYNDDNSTDIHLFNSLFSWTTLLSQPSLLCCCWLGGRKGICPVKNWVVGLGTCESAVCVRIEPQIESCVKIRIRIESRIESLWMKQRRRRRTTRVHDCVSYKLVNVYRNTQGKD